MIKAFVRKALSGEIDLIKHAEAGLAEAEKINETYHYITAFADVAARAQELQQQIANGTAKGKLFGVFITVKDGICVEGVESCASSAILKGYKPVFNATVVKRCLDEGAIILGKTVQDEFGFGGFATNVGIGFHKPRNPHDTKRATGGSSGGAAGFTQKFSYPHLALGESTGGSIVNPASLCGVIGLCPTYGRVSRYGLIDYGNSLDKIGSLAKTPEDAALLLEVIAGEDAQDSTTSTESVTAYSDAPASIQGLRIGIVSDAFSDSIDNDVRKRVLEAVYQLEHHGARRIELSLPTSLECGIPTYFLLSTAEASTNLAKFCGIRYGAEENLTGQYNDYFSRVRSNHLGEEAKRRILLGTFARMAGYRDAFYTKAAQVRALIIQEYDCAFETVDVLITPTVPLVAPTFEDIKNMTPLQEYAIDQLTVGPNLAGLPHISIPCGTSDGLPVGMMIIGPHFGEHKILQVANAWHKIHSSD